MSAKKITKLEPVIGLEIHVQLKTSSKMFCRCPADIFGKEPNSYVCPTCLGLPGALPVTNAAAVRLALLAGEALGSTHPPVSRFDRKNYFYPDLPKGYQISQYDQPLNIGGEVKVGERLIKLTRAHLEEDTGKLSHLGGKTTIDFNRSGVPLLEIVSEPEITSAAEARSYGQKVQLLMRYAGVSEADMEKGSLRMDANVSVRPAGQKNLGTKVEVKNMNSFRSVERALEYEIERQTELLSEGKKVIQETRGWVEGKDVTVTQRIKEVSSDYRYFPEPDLPEIEITPALLAGIKSGLVEMPDIKRERLIKEYFLGEQDVEVLTADPTLANFYEQALKDYLLVSGEKLTAELAKRVANWLISEFLYHFKAGRLSWETLKVMPAHLAELLYLFDQGKITANIAKVTLSEMFETGQSPSSVVAEKGYILQGDTLKLEEVAKMVVSANKEAVQDFHAGKTQSFGFLLGQMMRETKGQADPTLARQMLEKVLKDA